MRALLDVNVLIALLDAAHVHHRLATAWLARNIRHGWASWPDHTARQRAHHVAADVDTLGTRSIAWSRILSSRQVTDSYLLALAVAEGGRCVTFDQRVLPETVNRARSRNSEIIH
jgi:predicted nucleic acid-binding protein